MTTSLYRGAAIWKAKPGQEQALLAFTLEVLPQIRKVDGLHHVEPSRVSDPAKLLLYYWWVSAAHSERYISGPVYDKIAPRLQALMQGHLFVLTETANQPEAL